MTAPAWSESAIAELETSPGCPVCGHVRVADGWCRACGSDYRGGVGDRLWEASLRAAAALRARQQILEQVPVMAADLRPIPSVVSAPRERPRTAVPRSATGSSTTVQSVLAVAGAGLVAVAALVFTFFNPDLQDRALRSSLVFVVAAVFLLGAWLLVRRGLRMSAEAVGALGLVFVALAVASAASGAPARTAWASAAAATLVLSSCLIALGWLARLRSWFAVALLALAGVPLLAAPAVDSPRALTIGALASALAAFALAGGLMHPARRFASSLAGERVALTCLQAGAAAGALVTSVLTSGSTPVFWLANAVVLGAVATLGLASARRPAGATWTLAAGVAGALAFAALPAAAGESLTGPWFLAALPAAGAFGAVAVAAASARLPRTPRVTAATGALLVLILLVGPTIVSGLVVGAGAVLGVPATDDDLLAPDAVIAIALGLLAVGAGLAAAAAVDRRVRAAPTFGAPWIPAAATWFAVAAALVALASPAIIVAVRVAASLAAAALVALALRACRAGAMPLRHRTPLAVGAHAAIVLAGAAVVRADAPLLVLGGAGVIAALLLTSTTVPAASRFVHAGLAWAYGLAIIATLLARAEASSVVLLCLVAVVAGIGAIVATFTRVPARAWWAILAVTAIPFGLGIVQVVFERSGWTALSTAVLVALSLTLTVTRRPGLGVVLRALAAGTVLPALAVVTVCLGAQLLSTSGSPVVLPVIAALVAATLAARPGIRLAAVARLGEPVGDRVSLAVECSALLTAAIAVALAIVRDAAGAGTTLVVLVVLAAGFVVLARWGDRGYGWWLAGAASTGALWSAWVPAGVDLPEAYLLPPATAAAAIGALVAARGRSAALYSAGLAASVVPVLALLAVAGSPGADPARAYGLVSASAALGALGILLDRAAPRVSRLSSPTYAAAVVAGAAGAVQGVRWGLGVDAAPSGTLPLVALALGIGVAGALPAAVAGIRVRPGARWRRLPLVPAAGYVPLSAWTAIDSAWPTIWIMWSLMSVLLVGMVAVAAHARAPRTQSPPVVVLFALAFLTAVVAWSPRELRVEWFSVPLGLLLVAAGVLGSGKDGAGSTWRDWPGGARSSWATLAPGILVVFGASVAATYTDPQTWRAILVIVLALAAILAGATLRLAAPFLIGIVVLPIENALAFVVQIGRGIASMPWWITLSVVGAVLLIIAVTYERRSDAGFVARLRDLR